MTALFQSSIHFTRRFKFSFGAKSDEYGNYRMVFMFSINNSPENQTVVFKSYPFWRRSSEYTGKRCSALK